MYKLTRTKQSAHLKFRSHDLYGVHKPLPRGTTNDVSVIALSNQKATICYARTLRLTRLYNAIAEAAALSVHYVQHRA